MSGALTAAVAFVPGCGVISARTSGFIGMSMN